MAYTIPLFSYINILCNTKQYLFSLSHVLIAGHLYEIIIFSSTITFIIYYTLLLIIYQYRLSYLVISLCWELFISLLQQLIIVEVTISTVLQQKFTNLSNNKRRKRLGTRDK